MVTKAPRPSSRIRFAGGEMKLSKSIAPAAEELFAYHQRAFHLARRIIWNQELAEEAVQEAYLRAIPRLESGVNPPDLKAWFFRFVLNVAQSKLKSHRRRIKREERLMKSNPSTTNQSKEELRREIREAMNRLDESERVVVSMHYEMGLSYNEVSKVLNITERSVYRRMEKGLQNLKRNLSTAGATLASAGLIQFLQNDVVEIPPASLTESVQSVCENGAPADFTADIPAAEGSSISWIAPALFVASLSGVLAWQLKPIETSSATPTVDSNTSTQPGTVPEPQNDGPVDLFYSFENGPPEELKIERGNWYHWPGDDLLPHCMAVSNKGVLLRIPGKVKGPVMIEVKTQGAVHPYISQNANSPVHYRGPGVHLAWCKENSAISYDNYWYPVELPTDIYQPGTLINYSS